MNSSEEDRTILSALEPDELRRLLLETMSAHPLNRAFALSLMDQDHFSAIMEQVRAELNQLKVWVGMDQRCGAFASTHFTERTSFIFSIAENYEKRKLYFHCAFILCALLEMSAEVMLMGNQYDSEAENIGIYAFSILENWQKDSIPEEQLDDVLETLTVSAYSEPMEHTGLGDSLRKVFERSLGLIN